MISVWWNADGIQLFELILKGQAVNAKVYSIQFPEAI